MSLEVIERIKPIHFIGCNKGPKNWMLAFASMTNLKLHRYMSMKDFDELKNRLRQFANERDWDQFHSPKNLSMALIAEAAELVEHFQWLTEEQSAKLPPDKKREVELELADIFVYLVRLSDKLNVDLFAAVQDKMKMNEVKYPADQVRGSAKKYTEY
jgi:NTP pyrophosphatase (non-canonical NTP hydrolase)